MAIPLQIILDILKRLPVKSLLRFRCVSKVWLSVISDQYFIDVHRTQSLNRPDGNGTLSSFLVLTFNSNCRTLLVSIRNEDVVPIQTDFSFYSISHSVNGLICLDCSSEPLQDADGVTHPGNQDRVCVYNLSTKERIFLPPSGADLEMAWRGPQFVYTCCSTLGFDPSSNTYKVVRTWECDDKYFTVKHEIFTLGSTEWRTIPKDGGKDYCTCAKSICCDGVIYWKNGMGYDIVSFSLRDERFGVIPFPEKGSTIELIEIRGQPTLVDYGGITENGDGVMRMWGLERGGGYWYPKQSIKLPSCWDIGGATRPNTFRICGTHLGKLIIIPYLPLHENIHIFCYELESGKMTPMTLPWPTRMAGCARYYVNTFDYVESLVSFHHPSQGKDCQS